MAQVKINKPKPVIFPPIEVVLTLTKQEAIDLLTVIGKNISNDFVDTFNITSALNEAGIRHKKARVEVQSSGSGLVFTPA